MLHINPATGVWLAFILVFIVGQVVNKITKRPTMNWAAWLAGCYLAAFIISVAIIHNGSTDPSFELGLVMGYYLLPAGLAFAYSRSWRRRKSMANIDSGDPPGTSK